MLLGENTLHDLEYTQVIEAIARFAIHDAAKQFILAVLPSSNTEEIIIELDYVWETLGMKKSSNYLELDTYFYDLAYLEHLSIENYYLDETIFRGIRSNLEQIKSIQKHIKPLQENYPRVSKLILDVSYQKEITNKLNSIFKRNGEIKSTASPTLLEIRKELSETQLKIDDVFKKSLKYYHEYLDNIKESVIDNKRVLAVVAGMKKRVSGKFIGTSKTGSIAFIIPNAVLPLNKKLEELVIEEKEEKIKILKDLTRFISPYAADLAAYQELLLKLDVVRSKTLYAEQINAIKPQLNHHKNWKLIQAYHPLLVERNKANHIITKAQDIEMNPLQRLIVISGPNAGGKSITLKTIGLLQLMLQAGILVPVQEGSSMSFTDKIFTDIGDHQSIENRLSTYSYRLKQMAYFLRKIDQNSLLLIDEFGTGSDPLLGGGLAEVFLEEIYDRECFAVLTSHYTNIKIRTEALENAVNANMLFNQKTLEPTYQLVIGQAGSSFTFEVAEKNKIPYSIINRAKKKIEKEKLKFDKTISSLQTEKIALEKTVKQMNFHLEEQTIETENIKQTKDKLEKKLVDFQLLYNQYQKELNIGKKMLQIAKDYSKNNHKKRSIESFLKWLEIETSALSEENTTQKVTKIENELNLELEKKSNVIHQKIQDQKLAYEQETQQFISNLTVGDRVRIKGSTSIGSVLRIDKKSILVNYGKFTTAIPFSELEKV